ncbi:MAG: family 78 glycoside hydrolase catalytic domain [Lachnospiraceae bacterium]
MKITQLDIDGMYQPVGIDNSKPVFHFSVESEEIGAKILGYQIVVTADKRVFWDSDKQTYSGYNFVPYQGEALSAKTRYQVDVKLWGSDEPEAVIDTTFFETGFMTDLWEAHWIEPVQEPAVEEKQLPFLDLLIPNPEFWGGETRLKPVQRIRRMIPIDRPVKSARLYVSAHGIYQLFLNGEQLSNRRFAPENSAYNKILYYQTYDISEQLRQGQNCMGFLLADGWWIGRLGLSGESCNYGNKLGLIFEADLIYEDGSRETVYSDPAVHSKESYIQYSDLYIGEKQDLTNEDSEWMQPSYVEDNWFECRNVEFDKNNLTGQLMDPVEVLEEINAVRIWYSESGDLLVDFGQVVAGTCSFSIAGIENDVITVEHGEVLDKAGEFIYNIIGRNKDQKDVYVCRDGELILEPYFTYHGFRYARIKGIRKEQILKAKAVVIGTKLRKTGWFRCSNEALNQLQHNIIWSTKGNMFSIPTDCPQREKLGWTGDIQVFAKTGCFNYDLRGFLGAWLENQRAEQSENGEVPVVVPNPKYQELVQRIMSGGQNSSAGWGDACILLPYYLYQCYGDLSILERSFESMRGWLSYVKENCQLKPEGYASFSPEKKARNPYLWTKQYHFGDWLIPSLRALPDGIAKGTAETADVVGSCFYAISVACFVDICRVLGKINEVERYQELLQKIKNAVRDEFVDENGRVKDSNLQGLYVMILKAEVTEGELKQKVIANLVDLIHENGNCLDTGFASVSYLLDVLYENGHMDLAYELLLQTKAPSWLYMTERGATTIWENWMAVLEDGTPTESSYNHYAFGCVGDWMYRHIGGVRAEEPGYRRILFQPDLNSSIGFADCVLDSPYGRIALKWEQMDGSCIVEGCVPVGSSAKLIIGDQETDLESGKFKQEFKI